MGIKKNSFLLSVFILIATKTLRHYGSQRKFLSATLCLCAFVAKTSSLFILLLLFSPSQAQTFSNNTQFTIYDTSTVCVPIVVSGLPASINTSFGLSALCLNINFSNDSHLTIQLQSPDGTQYTLISGIGGNGQNFSTTCLGMNGTDGYIINSIAPFNGNYIPQNSLNIFNNNQNPNGIWKICVSNTYFGDNGFFQNGSITFSSNPPPNPPPPPVTCTFCTCSNGTGTCDLLPDMTASSLCIQQHHSEQPGKLWMANATPNIGRGPIEIHSINECFCDEAPVTCTTTCPMNTKMKTSIVQRVYQMNGAGPLDHYDRVAGKMTFHTGHHHLHVDDWANFSLRMPTNDPDPTKWPIVGTSVKQSFCLVNSGHCNSNPGYCKDANGNTLMLANIPNAGFGLYTGCGTDQGIYPGYLDMYEEYLNTPISLTNVCNGTYSIVSITDPKNNFVESDETNNWAALPIILTKQSAPSGTASFNYSVNAQDVLFINTSPNTSSYLWDFGDGNLDTSLTPMHNYPNAGTYTVSLKSVNGCYTKFTQTITVTTSEIFSTDNMNLQLYGNPIDENSYFRYYSSDGREVNFQVFDLAGRIISKISYHPLKAGLQKINIPVEVSNLAEGIYNVKIISANGVNEILKFGK
jgi:hypothetical protein